MLAYRWWGENNWIYGKYELNRLQHSSSERSICIWSCRASISLKFSHKGLVSRPWFLSICENRHCTICMYDFGTMNIAYNYTPLPPTSGFYLKDPCLSRCLLKSTFQMLLKMICALLAMILQSFGVYGEGKFEWKYG